MPFLTVAREVSELLVQPKRPPFRICAIKSRNMYTTNRNSPRNITLKFHHQYIVHTPANISIIYLLIKLLVTAIKLITWIDCKLTRASSKRLARLVPGRVVLIF
jgi:hypothetical protein